jgi:hypothetical protein
VSRESQANNAWIGRIEVDLALCEWERERTEAEQRFHNRKSRSADLPRLRRGRSEVSSGDFEMFDDRVGESGSTYTYTTMAAPLRPTLLPQCSACVRNYAFGGLRESSIGAAGLGQQVRGKKKLAKNTSSAVPVRLLKDVKTFGKKGMMFCLPDCLNGN